MFSIKRSVGAWEQGAVNLFEDVTTIQKMLRQAAIARKDPSLDPEKVDGVIARPPTKSATVKAIKAFQSHFMNAPDGLVQVNQRTWQRLLDAIEGSEGPTVNPNGSGFFFPFPVLPKSDWVSSPRKFGANRAGGKRAHAGCDLYFPQGTWIYAVGDGQVVRGPYLFYAETYAIEIDHGHFLARYGEVQEEAQVKTGDTVKAGQKIARVGHLIGIKVPSDMLHLELYDKSRTGPLTRSIKDSLTRADGVPFLRRRDLIDPAPFLNTWKANLPQPH